MQGTGAQRPTETMTMAILLMNLRHVPDDEAEEVRALLGENAVDFYETRPSKWGLSAGGIWLRDQGQADFARALLADYQRQRAERARADFAARRERGEVDTLYTRLLREPLRMLLYLVAIAAVLYLAMTPLLSFWRDAS